MESSQFQGRHKSALSMLLHMSAQISAPVSTMQLHVCFRGGHLMSLILLRESPCYVDAYLLRRPCMACFLCPVVSLKPKALITGYIIYRGICTPRESRQKASEALLERSDLQDSCAMRQDRRCEAYGEVPQILPVVQIPHDALQPATILKGTAGLHGFS